MKVLEQEFFSVSHAVSIGIRKNIWGQQKKKWEVYLSLSSGSQILLATEGARKEAKAYLKQVASHIGHLTGCGFMVADAGTTLVIMDAITRVYVDRQENWHVLLVEDVVRATHTIETGSKEKCDDAMTQVAGAVVQYQLSRGGASIVPGNEGAE